MIEEDLEIARAFTIQTGTPLFLAPPNDSPLGYRLPDSWHLTEPDPSVVDRWEPGMGLGAVGGWGVDFLDIDTRHGGHEAYQGLNGATPGAYGWVATPSGGFHSYIASLWTGSRDGIYQGMDLKGGRADGGGRGFVFLPPTIRKSKVDGCARPYTWLKRFDMEAFQAGRDGDKSGETLASHIRSLLSDGKVKLEGPDWWVDFLKARDPVALASALRTIDRLLGELANWSEVSGGRDFRSMLLTTAYTIGGYVAGGALERDDAHARLVAAVEVTYPVLDERDLLWIAQGLDDGGDRPFAVYTPEDELVYGAGGGDDEDGEPPWTIYNTIGLEPFDPAFGNSDQELAELVAERLYPGLRYAADAGLWLVRDREVWKARKDMAGWALARVARLMPLGSTPVPKDLTQRTEGHWQAVRRAKFLDSGGSGKVASKLKDTMRHSDHPASLELSALDAHPEIFWAGGLPYDLRASLEAPSVARVDPATPHLHTALCAPEDRDTPLWDRFVAAVWPDEAERSWALRVLAVSLTGYADAALPVLWGDERNGKTSVVEFLLDMLGTYGVTADPKLLAGVDNAHASIVFALKGARMAFVDEGPRRGHLATERLKQLTGGGRLTGNAMRADPVTFKTTHTLVMTSNEAPPMTDPALRARIRAIHCTGNKAEVRARREALTPAAWRREAPGVLHQMMVEAAGWLADRSSALTVNAPLSFQEVEAEEAGNQDPTREWVNTYTVPADPGTPGRQLHESFCSWFRRQDRFGRAPVPSETAFGRTLTDMGYPATLLGRGNERLRYRPLSVFGEPSGAAPTPSGAGAGLGAFGAGSDVRPSPAESASSSTVSSFVGEGGDSSPSTTTQQKQTYTQKDYSRDTTAVKGEPTVNTPREPAKKPDLPGVAGLPERVGTPTPPGNETVTTASPVQEGLESLPVVSGGLTKEAAEVARIAAEKKISKLEARKQLKEELIREAVAGAEGPHAQLPAAVDRAGRVLACTEDIARQLLDPVIEAGALTVDVETTGYPIGHVHYRLKTVQLGNEAVAVVLDPIEQAELIREYLGKATKLHAHSASADLVPLAVAGLLDYDAGWAKMHDTVIPAKLGDPQSTGSDPGLKKLSAAVLGDQAVAPAADEGREALFKAGKWLTNVKPHHPVEKSGWANVNPRSAVMLRYAASDVLDTAALAKRLPPVRQDIEARERVAEEMTARVAYRGFKIDHERVRTLTAEHSALQAQFGAQVREFGIENPGSAQQVAARLAQMGAQLPLTPGGSPSVAEHVLSVLRRSEGEKAVLAGAVLDYRHSSTVLGLFLAPYAQLCDLGDSRARPTVYTMGADTGRMTCTRPNAQQLPRAGGIRSIYTADPGMVFISADFSGVELRGAAALSQDPDMIRMIAEEDAGRFDGFHWQIARQAYGPEASKSDRYTAKRGVFGTFYGGGAAGLSKQIGVTEQEMFVIIDSLKSIAPGYFRWADGVRAAVRNGSTQFPSCSGRIIHLDQSTPHKAPAYCIQGSCRELLIDALLRWRDTRWGNTTVLPIHDELIAMVPADEAHDATLELVRCMESSLYGVEIKADPGKFDDEANQRFTGSTFWRDAE